MRCQNWMQNWKGRDNSTVSDRFRPLQISTAGEWPLPGIRDAGAKEMDEAAAPPREDPTTWLEPIAISLATPTWSSRQMVVSRVPNMYRAQAPRVVTVPDGSDAWSIEGNPCVRSLSIYMVARGAMSGSPNQQKL